MCGGGAEGGGVAALGGLAFDTETDTGHRGRRPRGDERGKPAHRPHHRVPRRVPTRRFGAISYVPELVVVAQLRELGPLVTAIVVAGRSGAGLASEIATMKVSEEIDALRSLGFDPVRWLVLPRCVALAIAVPILAWIGNVLALVGGLVATAGLTDMTVRAYVMATLDAITAGHFLTGLSKTPFLAVAIGMIACGQGLATRGGAAAVGARTTTAVVMAIFGVIVISALFTFVYALAGV